MTSRPYIDYYIKNNIIPVKQDIANIEKHLRRRNGLYQHLGIFKSCVKGKKVIEFGPGTGENAIYTASLNPSVYTFVDAHPLSIESLKNKSSLGLYPVQNINFINSEVLHFSSPEKYDLVLCEGIIHGQDNPSKFLQHMASFAGVGGLVVATTHSAISLFPEICRRLIYPIFSREISDRQLLLKTLAEFFAPDLSSLAGMSRSAEDWVQDNIMHPWPGSDQLVFSINDAISSLDGHFEIISTSPKFIQDWRWYKTIGEDNLRINEQAKKEVDRWALSFLDCRSDKCEPTEIGDQIEALCKSAINKCCKAWVSRENSDISDFLYDVVAVAKSIERYAPRTSGSLIDFEKAAKLMINGNLDADFGDFRSLFGRGQQYVSLERTN